MTTSKSIIAPLTLVLLTSCASLPYNTKAYIAAANAKPAAERINWPEEYEPSRAAFFVHNEIEIKASPNVVWEILIDAEAWPSWYVGAENVQVKDSKNGRLKSGDVFTWKTMDLEFESYVKEYSPPHRIAWDSRKVVIQGYHAYLIIPTTSGCRVVSDESFSGFLGHMQKIFIPTKLHRLHDIFLVELKKKAEAKSER